ncbi:MAG TPA: EamA family transporter [Verrucomicrobiae bacterium]|nr:EamA family transporter [Verrucomicrobiae bacterium]
MNEAWNNRKGIAFALVAAALFGLSTPLAKQVSPLVRPVLLAGLLYLGSGIGLGAYCLFRFVRQRHKSREAPLPRADMPWLAGAILAGGIVGPLFLMWGLAKTPASSASLLLNLEGLFTALLAWFVFKENFDARIALGMGLIAMGGMCLSWAGRPEAGVPWGALAILGACFAWAVDNNLTRKVSASDPVQIAMLKGLVAGGVNTTLGLLLGEKLPGAAALFEIGLIGFFGYGLSLTLFVLALRHIGTARTGAYFSTAPFVGAAVAVAFLGDALSLGFCVAAILMGLGAWLHLTERHEHTHHHEAMEHDHLHTHDEHHQHAHSPTDPPGEPHSHPHRHQELTHSHPHYPDIHHRHEHSSDS